MTKLFWKSAKNDVSGLLILCVSILLIACLCQTFFYYLLAFRTLSDRLSALPEDGKTITARNLSPEVRERLAGVSEYEYCEWNDSRLRLLPNGFHLGVTGDTTNLFLDGLPIEPSEENLYYSCFGFDKLFSERESSEIGSEAFFAGGFPADDRGIVLTWSFAALYGLDAGAIGKIISIRFREGLFDTERIWLDDVIVAGILSEKSGLKSGAIS